jgi:hypothetical protein
LRIYHPTSNPWVANAQPFFKDVAGSHTHNLARVAVYLLHDLVQPRSGFGLPDIEDVPDTAAEAGIFEHLNKDVTYGRYARPLTSDRHGPGRVATLMYGDIPSANSLLETNAIQHRDLYAGRHATEVGIHLFVAELIPDAPIRGGQMEFEGAAIREIVPLHGR